MLVSLWEIFHVWKMWTRVNNRPGIRSHDHRLLFCSYHDAMTNVSYRICLCVPIGTLYTFYTSRCCNTSDQSNSRCRVFAILHFSKKYSNESCMFFKHLSWHGTESPTLNGVLLFSPHNFARAFRCTQQCCLVTICDRITYHVNSACHS
jgi:hypothetical protein